MDNLRKIGYSDKVFQYKPSRNLRIRVVLRKPLELDRLKDAVAAALDDFEEYKVAPVKCGSDIFYEKNNREIAFFPDDDTKRYFGSEELNGYLFYILYGTSSFMLSIFHGLTDFKGMWAFLRDIIYRYALNTGLDVPDIKIQDEPLNDEERYDPYSFFADADAEEVIPAVSGNTFFVPSENKYPEDLNVQHEYTLTVSASGFLAMTREWKSSASCALAAIITNSLAKLYDTGDNEILLKITCDMRPVFESHSRVNMSEAVLLVSDKDLRNAPLSEHCTTLTKMMRSQFNRETFSKFMAYAVEEVKVKSGEKETADIVFPKPKLTYVLTYPGRMDLPEEYNVLVSDFELKGYFPIDSIRFTIKSTGDELRIGIDQVFDGDEIIKAIAESFRELGFVTEIKDEGRFGGDGYSLDLIREIQA